MRLVGLALDNLTLVTFSLTWWTCPSSPSQTYFPSSRPHQVIPKLLHFLNDHYCLTLVPFPSVVPLLLSRHSQARIHRFLEVTSPPAPLPPTSWWVQSRPSFYKTDWFFGGQDKATNQSHYRWLIKPPWWMVRLQTIHLPLHQIGDNTFSSETVSEIKTPVNCEELSLRLIRCSAFKDTLYSELNIIENKASFSPMPR